MTDPQGKVLDMIFGRWRSQILYAGVKLGIFDALTDGPKSAPAVASELALDSSLTYRLLRALASLELLTEDKKQQFSLTDTGQLLRKDHPQTLRGVTLLEEGPEHYSLWKHLPAMIREGRQNAFTREFGRKAFEHAAHDRSYGDVFNDAMTSYSSSQTDWVLEALADYDFSNIRHLCDIGGGHGHLLSNFLARNPSMKGTVLDLPSVVEHPSDLWADKLSVADRCTYAGGDMFSEVPAADAYTMKMILHDWNDAECERILQNASDAAPSGARMFIIEHVIPGPDTPHFAKLFDIHMMCWGTGRERTADEYGALLENSGWKYERTWFPQAKMMGVVEGRKA